MILSRWSAVVGVILPLLRKWVFGLKMMLLYLRLEILSFMIGMITAWGIIRAVRIISVLWYLFLALLSK